MSMIEESVYKSMQWAVFETNDYSLRRTLVHSLSVFLEAIWREGGLKGALPSEGFYVKCDETNNPPSVVDTGQVICEVGVAIAAPMEFIVFEIRQDPGGTAIVELAT
jgi:Phage tail sheath protein FI